MHDLRFLWLNSGCFYCLSWIKCQDEYDTSNFFKWNCFQGPTTHVFICCCRRIDMAEKEINMLDWLNREKVMPFHYQMGTPPKVGLVIPYARRIRTDITLWVCHARRDSDEFVLNVEDIHMWKMYPVIRPYRLELEE